MWDKHPEWDIKAVRKDVKRRHVLHNPHNLHSIHRKVHDRIFSLCYEWTVRALKWESWDAVVYFYLFIFKNNIKCHFLQINCGVQKTIESAFRRFVMPYQTYEWLYNNQTDKSPKLQIKRKVTNWWLCITVLESFHSGIQRHSSFGGQLMLLALYLNNPMYHHHTLFISMCQKAIQSYF